MLIAVSNSDQINLERSPLELELYLSGRYMLPGLSTNKSVNKWAHFLSPVNLPTEPLGSLFLVLGIEPTRARLCVHTTSSVQNSYPSLPLFVCLFVYSFIYLNFFYKYFGVSGVGAYGAQKSTSDSPELELTVVCELPDKGTGNQTLLLWKIRKLLNSWGTSSAPALKSCSFLSFGNARIKACTTMPDYSGFSIAPVFQSPPWA